MLGWHLYTAWTSYFTKSRYVLPFVCKWWEGFSGLVTKVKLTLLNRQEQSKEQSTWRLEAAIGEASSEGDAGRLMDLCLGHCFFIGFSHPNTFGPDCHLSPHVMSRQYLSHFQACMCRREACSRKGGSCLLVYWFLSSFFLPAAKPAGR